MKTRNFTHRFAFPVVAAALLTGSARAQTGGVIPITTNAPVVTIVATDPFASETGPDPGTFEVRRSAGTNSPVLVFYAIGGTAINGLDYQMISNTVLIPAGAWSSSITITPIDDKLVEGNETVVLRLFPSPLLSLIGVYQVGYPSNAVVTIADNDLPPGTNIPPLVRIGYPTNGTMFLAPANIPIFAEAHDLDGFVTTVEFFAGTNSLGIATNNPLVLSLINPFHIVWNNVSGGDYVLTAVATDDGGATATSDPVKITVQPPPALPVVNIVATKPDGTEFALLPCELTFPPCLIADRFDPAVFTVWRTGSTGTPLFVSYAVGGTASNGVDYFFLPGAVTIPEGASSATIEVVPIDDPDDVPSVLTKTVELTLQPSICTTIWPPGFVPPAIAVTNCYVVGPSNQAVAYIHEDNPDTNLPPVVNIVATKPDGTEFALLPCELASPPCLVPDRIDPAIFTVWRTGSTGTPLVVFYDVGGTASNGVDYFLTGTVTIAEGASSAIIAVVPIDDPDDVPPVLTKTVVLTVQPPFCPAIVPPPPGCYVVGASNQAVAYIHEDNPDTNPPPAVVTIVATDPNAAEIGPDPGKFTVTRTGDTTFSLAVFYSTGGTAINGLDYQRLSDYVLIPAGASSADIVVTPVDDSIEEGDETVVVQLISGIGIRPGTPFTNLLFPVPVTWFYTLGYPSNAVVTIADSNDGSTNLPPVVNIVARDPFASEGTNFWGINTATFVVRRSDGTNTDLTVFYDIGGTASNGVDYVALPGSVTIPAGRHSARIVVVPLDDADNELIETVVLKLREPDPPVAPPPYLIGFPSKAAAFILDTDQTRPPCKMLSDGLFHLCQPGTNGFCFRIEATSNLVDWVPVCTNIVTDAAIHFVDPDAASFGHRFYRALPEANLPPD